MVPIHTTVPKYLNLLIFIVSWLKSVWELLVVLNYICIRRDLLIFLTKYRDFLKKGPGQIFSFQSYEVQVFKNWFKNTILINLNKYPSVNYFYISSFCEIWVKHNKNNKVTLKHHSSSMFLDFSHHIEDSMWRITG